MGMSTADRISLQEGRFQNDNGTRVDLGLTFTSEQDLDQNLWINPDAAYKDLNYLLKVHQGELTPALSRIALKAVSLPLFVREFYGEATPIEDEREVQEIPQRNSRLLDAYMNLLGNEDVDRAMLLQAIDDATILQLVSRSLTSKETDDIIALPAGPEQDHQDRPTTFTVLRRKSLGRALLYISSTRPSTYIDTPEANKHRIHIKPADLLTNGASRFNLAEALIAEQQNDTEPEDFDLIDAASAHVMSKITTHFDAIQPQS